MQQKRKKKTQNRQAAQFRYQPLSVAKVRLPEFLFKRTLFQKKKTLWVGAVWPARCILGEGVPADASTGRSRFKTTTSPVSVRGHEAFHRVTCQYSGGRGDPSVESDRHRSRQARHRGPEASLRPLAEMVNVGREPLIGLS